MLVASDGPRVAAARPTVFLGSRGSASFTLAVGLRERSYHSGNWGGLLRNPATVLASALACLVDGRGRILVPGLRPPPIPAAVSAALATIAVGGGPDDPDVDADWGEPGLTPAERVIGWNTLEVLSLAAGNPDTPVNAIPGSARAHCQLRFVVGTDVSDLAGTVRAHLDRHGLSMVEVRPGHLMNATRADPDGAWVRFALASLERTDGAPPALLPNLGGSLPNDAFADELGDADHLDPALLPGVRPARPGRAPARAAGPPGPPADDGAVLGPGRGPAGGVSGAGLPTSTAWWRWSCR